MLTLLNPAEWIGDKIQSFFIGILLWLDGIVYSLVSWVYKIILLLSQQNILSNTAEVGAFVNRLYVVIGVIMMFVLAYALLKSLINPDELTKGKQSPVTIIKNVIISIALIAFIPTIFNFAMSFQNALLMENTVGKIIIGTESSGNATDTNKDTLESGGNAIASTVLGGFLHPVVSQDCNVLANSDSGILGNVASCSEVTVDDKPYADWWSEIETNGNFLKITSLTSKIVEDGTVDYLWIVSTVAGVFVLVVLIGYCFDIALRMIKLAVFQLMAPIPILCRIVPNDQAGKVFSNWLKATISTYLEVFIRLGILFFAIWIMKLVRLNITNIFVNANGASLEIVLITQVLIILGIIMFVKQAPSIIKDITGLDGGKYSPFTSAMRGLSSIGALGTGAVRGFTTGFDKDHPVRSVGRGLINSTRSGLSSLVGASGKDYKSLADIKKHSRSSVEEAINKQRQRQADKDAKNREIEAYQDANPQKAGENKLIYQARTRTGYAAKGKLKGIKEWAGISNSDPAADARTKEALNAIGSLVGSMQDAWKKDPGFVKAKEEANNAEALWNTVKNMSDQAVLQQYGITKSEVQQQYNLKKALKDSQERTLQTSASKVNQIAGEALKIQTTLAKYGDVSLLRNIEDTLDKSYDLNSITDPIKKAEKANELNALKASAKKWGNLSDPKIYQQFVSALGSGDQSAIDYLNVLDKVDIAGKQELTQITAREIARASGKKDDKK